MTTEKRVQVAAYLSPALHAWILAQAAEASMSKSEYISRVLERWRENSEGGGDASLEDADSRLVHTAVGAIRAELREVIASELREVIPAPRPPWYVRIFKGNDQEN